MMNFDLVASVVLYHNSEEQIRQLIKSFANTVLNLKVILVDNTEGGTYFLQDSQLPDYVIYHPLKRNVGYGTGHNQAIFAGKYEARYHLVVNPDVHFRPEILGDLVNYMDNHPEVGLLMPKVTWPDGRDQGLRKLLPTPFDLIFRRFIPPSLKFIFKKRLDQYELDKFSEDQTIDVPVLSGCFMFLRKQWLKESGGFDERFFLYLEDVDLSRSMLQKGINRYWPEVNIVHEYQKDSYKGGKHLKWHIQSALRYFEKYGWLIDRERKKINASALNQKPKG